MYSGLFVRLRRDGSRGFLFHVGKESNQVSIVPLRDSSQPWIGVGLERLEHINVL